MEKYSTRITFGFSMDFLFLTRRDTTVNCWVFPDFKLVVIPSLITIGVFAKLSFHEFLPMIVV